jgi:hypothetical protein
MKTSLPGNPMRPSLVVAVVFFVLLFVVVLFVGYRITREETLLVPDQRLQQMLDKAPSLMTDPAANPLLADARKELARAQGILAAPATKSVPPVEPPRPDQASAPDAWRMADSTAATPPMPVPNGVSVYEPVSVDMDNPVFPEAGQQTTLTLPGGERLKVNVKTSTTNPNGDYTWRGHLDGYGADEYPVVMTYGGSSVFATVTTPSGSYTLESIKGSGWIYKNPSEFELSTPGARDYLEIPQDHP